MNQEFTSSSNQQQDQQEPTITTNQSNDTNNNANNNNLPTINPQGYPNSINLKPIIREKGLGSLQNIPDEGLIEYIFPFLTIQELCLLSSISRTFLVLSEDDRLWRQFTFNYFEGNFQYEISWKFTFVKTCFENLQNNLNDLNSLQNSLQNVKFKNLKKNTFTNYTSTLYTKWSRSNFEMNQFDLPYSHIEKIPVERLTFEEFTNNYNKIQKPVIITNLINNWKAFKEWQINNFLDKYGNVEFKTDQMVNHFFPHFSEIYKNYLKDKKEGNDLQKYDHVRRQHNLKMKFKNYFKYMKENKDENPIYIFDSKFGEKDERLLNEYEIPFYFKEDFFELCLPKEDRPLFRWLVIGPARSGTQWHMDPYLTTAWNALICGRKRWLFYPMNHVSEDLEEAIEEMKSEEQAIISERLKSEKEHKMKLLKEGKLDNLNEDEFEIKDKNKPIPSYIPCSEPIQWLTDEYYEAINSGRRPWECVQYPGELIFVPSGWWHMVLNLDDTVAVTQNLCDSSNVHMVYCDLIKRDPKLAKLLRRGLAGLGKLDLIKSYMSEEEIQDALQNPTVVNKN
ncbi:hypothetical protein ABK040_007242 [Willaertia magna]